MNLPAHPFTMQQLAAAFCARLRRELGADMAEVIRLNRQEIDPNVCHSHDFLDANMTMLGALQQLLEEVAPNYPRDDVAMVHDYSQICDAAWRLARAHHFTL